MIRIYIVRLLNIKKYIIIKIVLRICIFYGSSKLYLLWVFKVTSLPQDEVFLILKIEVVSILKQFYHAVVVGDNFGNLNSGLNPEVVQKFKWPVYSECYTTKLEQIFGTPNFFFIKRTIDD